MPWGQYSRFGLEDMKKGKAEDRQHLLDEKASKKEFEQQEKEKKKAIEKEEEEIKKQKRAEEKRNKEKLEHARALAVQKDAQNRWERF